MKAAIISFSGASGYLELAEAIETLTDMKAEVIDDQVNDLSDYDLVFLSGGAAYGDALRPGAIARQTPVADALKNMSKDQKIVGIGNGFQVLCEMGLLPGGFLANEDLNFHEEFVPVTLQENVLTLPVSAKFGQYVLNEEVDTEQVIMLYENHSPFGENASAVAAVLSADQRVLGVFPHPERACQSWQQSQDGAEFFAWLQSDFARKEGNK